MPTKPALLDLLRRALTVLVAVMLSFGPSAIVSANAQLLSSGHIASPDIAYLFDDTPDVGKVKDAPPPVVGGTNLYFAGIVSPDVEAHRVCLIEPQHWHVSMVARLNSCPPGQLQRPPRSL